MTDGEYDEADRHDCLCQIQYDPSGLNNSGPNECHAMESVSRRTQKTRLDIKRLDLITTRFGQSMKRTCGPLCRCQT